VKSESKSKSDEIISEELMASQELFPRKRTGSSVSAESDDNTRECEQKLVDESKATGTIKGRVLWDYVASGAGPVLLTLAIGSTLAYQGLFHYTDIWLTDW
ncbi:unnamed protein product, partial [Oppiella nova]